jgi:phosphatidylglycerol lysyltransferase
MTALAFPHPRARAFELVRRFGRDTVSFQGLESGYRYFFDGDDAVVAFVDTGGAWVAAGSPIAPPARISEVAYRFAEAALSQRRRVCFFAAEQSLGGPAVQIGEQPVWACARWDQILTGAPSLRYQLRRARHKDVVVRELDPGELAIGTSLRTAVDELGKHWQDTHRMPPMRFLVQLEPLAFASERTIYVAEQGDRLVGLASAVPVYARRRLFLEDLVRAPDAPNGTVELLVDAIMRATASRVGELTLGLAPLAGDVARWLRFARWAGGPFYDFDGLRRFKAKLRPHAWEPVYLCTAPGGSRLAALRDSLRAFAGGSLVGFATRTLFRR